MTDHISKTLFEGIWYTIHISALKMGEDSFLNWIILILNSLPCSTCKSHALEYLRTSPPELFKNTYDEKTGELIGMFKWTWKFHNDVNLRLSKKVLDYNTTYKMYSDENVCSTDCGN